MNETDFQVFKITYKISSEIQKILKDKYIECIRNSWKYDEAFKKYLNREKIDCKIVKELISVKVFFCCDYITIHQNSYTHRTGRYTVLPNINRTGYDITEDRSEESYEYKVAHSGNFCAETKSTVPENTLKFYDKSSSKLEKEDMWAQDYNKVIDFIKKHKSWQKITQSGREFKNFKIEKVELEYCEKCQLSVSYESNDYGIEKCFLDIDEKDVVINNCKISGKLSERYIQTEKKLLPSKIINYFLVCMFFLSVLTNMGSLVYYFFINDKMLLYSLFIRVAVFLLISLGFILVMLFLYNANNVYCKPRLETINNAEIDKINKIIILKCCIYTLFNVLLILTNVFVAYKLFSIA